MIAARESRIMDNEAISVSWVHFSILYLIVMSSVSLVWRLNGYNIVQTDIQGFTEFNYC